MSGPDTIHPVAWRQSIDEVLDGRDIVCLRERESVECTTRVHRQLRLTELRVVRGGGTRFFEPAANTYRQALDTFVWGLPPGDKVSFLFAFDEPGTFSLHARFSAERSNRQEATRAAADLVAGFDASLAAAALSFRFADDADADLPRWHSTWHAIIVPPGLRLADSSRAGTPRKRLSPRLVGYSDSSEHIGVVIAPPRVAVFTSIDALLRSLRKAGCATRLIISFRAHAFQAEEIRLLDALRQRVAGMPWFPRTDGMAPVNSAEVAEPVETLLRRFERDGKAVEISARIEAAAPLPDTIRNFAAGVTWGTRECSREPDLPDRDWRRLFPCGQPLPQWMPSTAALEAMGTPTTIAAYRPEQCEGLLLGRTIDGDEVRLSESARGSHLYACGAPGSGKSTLLANMVLQDTAAGRGLILIDPHGDITSDVLARVPAEATERVVVFDLADSLYAPGLNMFDFRDAQPEMAKSLVCGELLRIFKSELYPDVPEGFGPMFEAYYRNAVMLLLEAKKLMTPTLIDVPRIFQDETFRRQLIEICPSRHVRDFWKRTAERVTDDEIELLNIAPYVISKFEPFLGSRAIRTIVGQKVTTLDFRRFMDEGQIILISLAKGVLGTNEARVLGLLLLQQIQIACMSRVRMPRSERRPTTLYVDEAQSFIGGSLTEIVAEARKFGLGIVLASQTLGQLSGRTSRALIDVVLNNVANLFALRVGVTDAELLAPWFRPYMTVDDLVGMANFRAAARILQGTNPALRVLIDLPPLPPLGEPTVARAIIASSRAAYCHLRDEVEAKLQA